MAQSLKEKTAKGLFWGGFSNIFQQVIQLCFGIFMGRILSPDDFGIVGMLSIFTLLASALQESGFSTALINKRNASQIDYTSIFWLNISISLCLYLVLFFASPAIAIFFNQPLLQNLSKIVFLSFVFNAFGIIQNTILTKEIEMKKLTIVNLCSILISCIIGLTFALLHYSYWAIAIQMVSLSLSKTIILWIVSNWRPSWLFSKSSIKEMLPFSTKVLLSNLTSHLSTGVYSFLLGKHYNEEQVGYYSQANKWYIIPFSIVYGIVNTTAYPVLAEVNNEPERQHQVFRKMLRFTSFISFPLILGFAFVAPEIIPILITDKWNNSIPIIQLLCIWGSFMPIIGLYFNILTTRGYSGTLLIFNIVYGLILITTLIVAVDLGIIKMILFNLVINFIFLFSILLVTKKKVQLSIVGFIKDVFPFFIITLCVFGIAYGAIYQLENPYLILSVKILISVLLYILIMKISKIVIFKEAIGFIKQKLPKSKGVD